MEGQNDSSATQGKRERITKKTQRKRNSKLAGTFYRLGFVTFSENVHIQFLVVIDIFVCFIFSCVLIIFCYMLFGLLDVFYGLAYFI